MQRSPDNDFVWLRDRLPNDMPVIRSTIYGYDTQLLNSESIQTIDDLASSFIARLIAIGLASVSAKPLVLLAHSLGGILLRSALIQMANSGDEENCILSSIKMIVFFGVPTTGMHMSHLLSMVKGYPNEALIQLLSPESDYLSSLNDHFSGIACIRKIRLVYAYETKLSHTTKVYVSLYRFAAAGLKNFRSPKRVSGNVQGLLSFSLVGSQPCKPTQIIAICFPSMRIIPTWSNSPTIAQIIELCLELLIT